MLPLDANDLCGSVMEDSVVVDIFSFELGPVLDVGRLINSSVEGSKLGSFGGFAISEAVDVFTLDSRDVTPIPCKEVKRL